MRTYKPYKKNTSVVIFAYTVTILTASLFSQPSAHSQSSDPRREILSAEEQARIDLFNGLRRSCDSKIEKAGDAEDDAVAMCSEVHNVTDIKDCDIANSNCMGGASSLRALTSQLASSTSQKSTTSLIKKAKKTIDKCPQLGDQASEEFADESANTEERISALKDAFKSAQDQRRDALLNLTNKIRVVKTEVEDEEKTQIALMTALREVKDELPKRLKDNYDNFERTRQEALSGIDSSKANLADANAKYYKELRDLDLECHKTAQEAVGIYQKEIVKAMQAGKYMKRGGLNRGTGSKLYGNGLSGRLDDWGQKEFEKCMQSTQQTRAQLELERNNAAQALKVAGLRLEEQITQAQLSKAIDDNSAQKEAENKQTDIQTQFLLSQKKLVEKTNELAMLQSNPNAISPMAVSMNNSLPAELAAVVDANHSENMAQSALMQAQMEKSMLMTQTGFFDKKKVPRKKTSQGTRYSEATSFSEVAAALAKYARAVSEKDRVCKERDNADPNKLSLSPITYPDDALR